jgi:hypothetical protein
MPSKYWFIIFINFYFYNAKNPPKSRVTLEGFAFLDNGLVYVVLWKAPSVFSLENAKGS